MTDRGFTIEDYLTPLGVSLEIHAFLRGRRSQVSVAEDIKSQQIAKERIRVERIIQRLECYYIFERVIPVNILVSLNQIVTVCAFISNF